MIFRIASERDRRLTALQLAPFLRHYRFAAAQPELTSSMQTCDDGIEIDVGVDLAISDGVW